MNPQSQKAKDAMLASLGLAVVVTLCIGAWLLVHTIVGGLQTAQQNKTGIFAVDTPVPTAIAKPRIVSITQAYYPGATVTQEGQSATIIASVKGQQCTQLDMESRIYKLFRDLHQKLGITHTDLTLLGPDKQPAVHVVMLSPTAARINWSSSSFDVAWLLYDTKDLSQRMIDYASCA